MIRPASTTAARKTFPFRYVCIFLSTIAVCCIISIISSFDERQNEKSTNKLMVDTTTPRKLSAETSVLAESPPLWSYKGSDGPTNWGNLSSLFRKCGVGAQQSPINILDSNVKTSLHGRPRVIWNGYESSSSLSVASSIKQSFDEHGFKIEFTDNAPTITKAQFTQYLDIVPLDKLQRLTFTLTQVLFKTPSEHRINGKRFPCEVQFMHECSATTTPSCPGTERLVISLMLTRAFADMESYGMESPPFLSGLVSDMKLSAQLRPLSRPLRADESVPPVGFAVQNDGLHFRKWVAALEPYLGSFYELRGSLTQPPCSEPVTWLVLDEAFPADSFELDYLKAGQHHNTRPLQSANGRPIFKLFTA